MNQAGDILFRIVADRRARLAERPFTLGEVRQQAEATPRPPPVLSRLRRDGAMPRVIAEFKRRSPSAGWLSREADPVAVARSYAGAGAAMASVLTNGPFFGGSLDDLSRVARSGHLLPLRKDFLLDEYDLCASRAAGAAAVLVIARLFPDRRELQGMIAAAADLGLSALVEAHTLAEAVAAREAGAVLIGINHRDLATQQINLDLSAGLRGELGPEPVLVAESGLRRGSDLHLMVEREMDAVLIGEALMREPDPGAALQKLLADARP
jgi:indole-3-glycerol phosphate synthase